VLLWGSLSDIADGKHRPVPQPAVRLAAGPLFLERSFRINEPDPTFPAPKYDTGQREAGFNLELDLYPLVFFMRGPLANVGVGFDFFRVVHGGIDQQQIGVDLRYRWNLLDYPASPTITGGLGYDRLSATVDWGMSMNRPMPDTIYDCLHLLMLFDLPLLTVMRHRSTVFFQLGAIGSVDYRYAASSGEVEDDAWYGDSETHGYGYAAGGYIRFFDFRLSASYVYQEYNYTFTEAGQRLDACKASAADCKRAAGGAEDSYSGVVVGISYNLSIGHRSESDR
jgi:hypothetical protein